MIIEALFGFLLELLGEVVSEAFFETFCRGLARLVPLRLPMWFRHGASWRRHARREIAARRLAKGLA